MVVADLTSDERQDIIFYSQATNRLEVWGLSDPIDDPPRHDSLLTLGSHGRSLVVGAFLSAEERLEVAVFEQRHVFPCDDGMHTRHGFGVGSVHMGNAGVVDR